jgi:hypothetical protein
MFREHRGNREGARPRAAATCDEPKSVFLFAMTTGARLP